MADPKYANLPGIAYDQPDVYETSDLPESDQLLDNGDESENIEKISLSADEAYNKFQGKRLDSSRTDFSDRISRSRRIGYDAIPIEYEMAGEGGEPENVRQKYNRLHHEIQELMEDVSKIKETVKEEKKGTAPSLTTQQIQLLQKQLTDLQLEQVLGSEIITDMGDPQGALRKKLLSQLETFKQGQSKAPSGAKSGKTGTPPPAAGATADQILYEMHYKPELAKFQQGSKTAEIEKRMDKLESVIGPEPEKFSSLSSATNQKSLMEAVRVLSSKMALLEPSHLDQVEGRLQTLGVRLNHLAEKKQPIEDADKQSKITEIHELLKKTDALSTSLPAVTERLIALSELHAQALQFTKVLTQLDVTQQQIVGNLSDNQKSLKELNEGFGKNMDIIKNNITSLESRINSLKK